jgi:hypothetical protein
MYRTKTFISAIAIIVTASAFIPSEAEAGPLLDWIRGRRARRTAPWYRQNAAAVSQSASCGLQPGVCRVDCQKTCQRTVVNYVPQTCYRSCWKRIPVTQYRPVTNTDPCSGCTVTCMRPCTTYSWKMERVPYTTYRPVYRTETYKVPVTYFTTDCGNTNPSCTSCNTGCDTCNTGGQTVGPAFNSGGQPTPADSPPSINGSVPTTSTGYYQQPTQYNAGNAMIVNPTMTQRPVNTNMQLPPDTTQLMNLPNMQSTPLYNTTPTNTNPVDAYPLPDPQGFQWENNPAASNDDKQARDLLHQRWSYSPVRLAKYESEVQSARPATQEFQGELEVVNPSKSAHPNAIWMSK